MRSGKNVRSESRRPGPKLHAGPPASCRSEPANRSVPVCVRQPARSAGERPRQFGGSHPFAGGGKTSVEIEKAEKLLKKGEPFFKDNPGFNLALGSLYLKKGDLANAEDSIKKALAREPDSMQAHVLMGDCLLRKKDHDGAALEYRKAVELSPAASMALIKLAEFYLLDNNLAEAKRILSESAAKSPDFLPASLFWQE